MDTGYVRLKVEINNLAKGEPADDVAEWVAEAVAREYPGLDVKVTVLGYAGTVEVPA